MWDFSYLPASGNKHAGCGIHSRPTSYRDQPPRDEAQDREDEKARRASIEKWEAFCKPTRTFDNEGVGRLVYAKKGCEFGRSE